MKPVLLAAFLAAMLVSPALADTAAVDTCFAESSILSSAPSPEAKLVRKLTGKEVRTFVMNATVEDHIDFEDGIDAVNIYSAPDASAHGLSVFFTLKGGCVEGTGVFKTESLGNLLTDKTL